MTRAPDEHPPCHDCGVDVGQPHEGGCDVAACLWTGGQRLACDAGMAAACGLVLRYHNYGYLADALAEHVGLDDPEHDCGRDVWTGEWPGKVDAVEFGWYVYPGPPTGGGGWEWVRCPPDHPDARPDLNRLVTEARWDRIAGRWVKR